MERAAPDPRIGRAATAPFGRTASFRSTLSTRRIISAAARRVNVKSKIRPGSVPER